MNNKTAIVPNTNGRYVAYDDGRIFDLKTNKFVAYHKTKRGWLQCHIWQNEIRKTINVHRVIMMSFFGESDLTVNHKDGNKLNNHISNLEYMSRKDQNIHRSKVLKRGNRTPVICVETGEVFETIKDAGEKLNIDHSHISACCKKKYGFKTVCGYHFEYYNPSRVAIIERQRKVETE